MNSRRQQRRLRQRQPEHAVVVGRAARATARRRRRTRRRSRGRTARCAPRAAAPASRAAGGPEPGWRSGAGAASQSAAAITTSSPAYSTGTKRQPPGMKPTGGAGRDQRDQRRADQLRDRRADVAGAEHAQREPLALAAGPRRVPGDADRERVARDAEAERADHQLGERRRVRDQQTSGRRWRAAAPSSARARRCDRSGCRAAGARSIR